MNLELDGGKSGDDWEKSLNHWCDSVIVIQIPVSCVSPLFAYGLGGVLRGVMVLFGSPVAQLLGSH